MAPSSRSQYYAKYSESLGTRTESPPINLWQQRQQQRSQERDKRAQSAPKPRASPRTESTTHRVQCEHRERDASVAKERQASPRTEPTAHRVPREHRERNESVPKECREQNDDETYHHAKGDQLAPKERSTSSLRGQHERQERARRGSGEHRERNDSVPKEREEKLDDDSHRRSEGDQSAQRERSTSSLRGRQERRERAHSALRERHERTRSARRERQDRVRSVTGEHQHRPQSAPKARTSESQPAQSCGKRTQSLILDFEAKSRKRPVSIEHELEAKKMKAFRPSEEQPVMIPSDSKVANEQVRNVTDRSQLSVELEPMTDVGASPGGSETARCRSKEPSYRKHGRQFVHRSQSRERSVPSTPVDPVPHVTLESSSILHSQVTSTVEGNPHCSSHPAPRERVKHMIAVETVERDDEEDSWETNRAEESSSSKQAPHVVNESQTVDNLHPLAGSNATASDSSDDQHGYEAVNRVKQSAFIEKVKSIERRLPEGVAEHSRVGVPIGLAAYRRRAYALTNANRDHHAMSVSASSATQCSSPDEESVNVTTTGTQIPPSNTTHHEPPLRTYEHKLVGRSRRTYTEFDELGNIEVVTVGSDEMEDGVVSPKKKQDAIDKPRLNSIREDRKGNVEVVDKGTKSKTSELINAWSQRLSGSMSEHVESKQPSRHVPNAPGCCEKDGKTPTMSNGRLSRKSTGQIRISSSIGGDRYSCGVERFKTIKTQRDIDGPDHENVHNQASVVGDSASEEADGDNGERSTQNADSIMGGRGTPASAVERERENERSRAPVDIVASADEQQSKAKNNIKSNSIDQLRQRIDRNKVPSRCRLSIDPCASIDPDLHNHGEKSTVEMRKVGVSEALPPLTPSFLNVRADPPTTKDSELRRQ